MKTVFDDTFTYMLRPRTKGTWCHLRVLLSTVPSSERAIIIATQLKSSATSIMNVAELLASYTVSFFGLNPHETTYVEHWTTDSSEFRGGHYPYALVHFDWEESGYGLDPHYVAHHPEWEYVSDSYVSDLIRSL